MSERFFVIFIVMNIFSLVPSFSQVSYSPVPLAIMPFEHPEQLESTWVDQIETSFLKEIIEKGKGQFIIVERSKIETLIKEQELQASLGDETTACRLGQLIGANKIILGRIVYTDNTHSTITISIRLVDVETGKIISAPQVDSDLYLGTIRYWISKLVNKVCGIATKEESLILIPLPEVKLPKIPPPEKDVTLPIEEYKNLQKKIIEYAQSYNFIEAVNLLNKLSLTISKDLNNPYFKNNAADLKYLTELSYWHNNSIDEIKKVFVATEVSKAIKVISNAKTDYLALMRNHISPADPRAIKIRWERVIDIIASYKNADAVFKDPLVEQAYGNVFRIRLVDDLEESQKGILIIKVSKPEYYAGTTTITIANKNTGVQKYYEVKNDKTEFRLEYIGETIVDIECDGETVLKVLTPRTMQIVEFPIFGKILDSFFLNTEAGINIPIGSSADFMGLGMSSTICFGYTFVKPFGCFSISILSGTTIDFVKEGFTERYTMYSIPLGLNLAYKTNFNPSFNFFAEFGGGEVFNILSYTDNSNIDSVNTQFITCALGAGYAFNKNWGISLYARFTCMFFQNILTMDISPGIRAELYLR